jgi:hypothetical protein
MESVGMMNFPTVSGKNRKKNHGSSHHQAKKDDHFTAFSQDNSHHLTRVFVPSKL